MSKYCSKCKTTTDNWSASGRECRDCVYERSKKSKQKKREAKQLPAQSPAAIISPAPAVLPSEKSAAPTPVCTASGSECAEFLRKTQEYIAKIQAGAADKPAFILFAELIAMTSAGLVASSVLSQSEKAPAPVISGQNQQSENIVTPALLQSEGSAAKPVQSTEKTALKPENGQKPQETAQSAALMPGGMLDTSEDPDDQMYITGTTTDDELYIGNKIQMNELEVKLKDKHSEFKSRRRASDDDIDIIVSVMARKHKKRVQFCGDAFNLSDDVLVLDSDRERYALCKFIDARHIRHHSSYVMMPETNKSRAVGPNYTQVNISELL